MHHQVFASRKYTYFIKHFLKLVLEFVKVVYICISFDITTPLLWNAAPANLVFVPLSFNLAWASCIQNMCPPKMCHFRECYVSCTLFLALFLASHITSDFFAFDLYVSMHHRMATHRLSRHRTGVTALLWKSCWMLGLIRRPQTM